MKFMQRNAPIMGIIGALTQLAGIVLLTASLLGAGGADGAVLLALVGALIWNFALSFAQ